jgi:hypothetical protein
LRLSLGHLVCKTWQVLFYTVWLQYTYCVYISSIKFW